MDPNMEFPSRALGGPGLLHLYGAIQTLYLKDIRTLLNVLGQRILKENRQLRNNHDNTVPQSLKHKLEPRQWSEETLKRL